MTQQWLCPVCHRPNPASAANCGKCGRLQVIRCGRITLAEPVSDDKAQGVLFGAPDAQTLPACEPRAGTGAVGGEHGKD